MNLVSMPIPLRCHVRFIQTDPMGERWDRPSLCPLHGGTWVQQLASNSEWPRPWVLFRPLPLPTSTLSPARPSICLMGWSVAELPSPRNLNYVPAQPLNIMLV